MPITSAPAALPGREPARSASLAAFFFLLDYPFANRLYPGSLDVIERLSTLGADGHPVRRRRRLSAAQGPAVRVVRGGRRPRADLHSQGAAAGRRREALSGRALRLGGRQAAHPDRGKEGLGVAPDDRFPAQGHYAHDPQALADISAGRHHDRAHRRSACNSICPSCSRPAGLVEVSPCNRSMLYASPGR